MRLLFLIPGPDVPVRLLTTRSYSSGTHLLRASLSTAAVEDGVGLLPMPSLPFFFRTI